MHILFAGEARANIHGGIFSRDVYQDSGPGFHIAQKQLHAKFLEHHGLLCRVFRVGIRFSAAFFLLLSLYLLSFCVSENTSKQ